MQSWFDSLPEEPDRYEIIDLLEFLQKTNDRLWPDAVFDRLEGAGGISEIKVPNIRCFRDGKFKVITYRIYGFFGPRNIPHSYTFLHGTHKNVKNDTVGKLIAKGRFDEFTTGTASIQKFEFQVRPNPPTSQGTRCPQ